MAYRIIVAIDVDADSLKEAYRKVSADLKKIGKDSSWESTDEWYDDDGEAVDVDEVQEIRMSVFAEM